MKKRILIADDDPAVREALKKVLEAEGFEVLLAADGDEAEARVSSEPLDLLVLDLRLPKQSGWNVFGLATALKPQLPIVILTGLKDQIENRFLPGVDALLEKPLEAAVLLRTVNRLLSEPAIQRLTRLSTAA